MHAVRGTAPVTADRAVPGPADPEGPEAGAGPTVLPPLVDMQGFFDDILETLLCEGSFPVRGRFPAPAATSYEQVVAGLEQVVAAHPSLGSGFRRDAAGDWCQVLGAAEPSIHLADMRYWSGDDLDGRLEHLALENSQRLALDGPTTGFLVVRLPEDRFEVLCATHHLVADHASHEILRNDVRRVCAAGDADLPGDGYAEAVRRIAAHAAGPELMQALEAWEDLPWETFRGPPSRARIRRLGSSHLFVVPDIWGTELPIADEHAATLLDCPVDRVTEHLVALLGPPVSETYGGPVPTATVGNGRLLRDGSGATVLPPGILTRAVGWFALTGLVVLGDRPLDVPPPDTWGLLQRMGARQRIRDLLDDYGGPPGLWLNAIRGRWPATHLPDEAWDETTAYHLGRTPPDSATFVGIPMSLDVAIHPDGVRVRLTWDETVCERDMIRRFKRCWLKHLA